MARAKSYVDDVEFSPEDGYRSDPDFMCEVCQLAVDNGATTLNIPDTVGFAVPEDYGKLIAYVIDNVRGEFIVSTHCHDDLGLAVANSWPVSPTARCRWSARSTAWASAPATPRSKRS